MANKTVIISILNEAYAEENGLLDLFLRSFREGEDTEFLINHLLLVAVDKMAFQRCKLLGLHCYRLVTEGLDFSEEVLFMSEGFIKMMWRRTLFLGDVLRHGYSFIFTVSSEISDFREIRFSVLDKSCNKIIFIIQSQFHYSNIK